MGRRSMLHVNIRGHMGWDSMAVGGNVTPVVEATIALIEQERR